MAREFAQIKLSIWADDEWRDLSPDARYLYLTLLTSPTLTHCGTADWRPARISALNGQPRDLVQNAGAEMVDSLHLLIDEETEEVLIRSFIRNDGLMKQPRMAVSMANAYAAVASRPIRGVLVHELKRLRKDFPDLSGWDKEKATDLLDLASIDPSTYPLGKGRFGGGFTPGLGQTQTSVSGSTKGLPTPAPSPATATSSLTPSPSKTATADALAVQEAGDEGFEAFWGAYSKKVGRGAAVKAWGKAIKKADDAVIIAAAAEHADWHKRNRTEDRFVPHAATWLNEERWADERSARTEQPRSRAQNETDALFDAAMQRAIERERNAG